MTKHCPGCSHPTICRTHGCGAEEARRNDAAKLARADTIERLTAELSEAREQLGKKSDAIQRLWEERDRLRDELNLCSELKREYQQREIAALERAEAAERDARRYRWLREHTVATGLVRWVHPLQFLDAAIDAARAKEQG